MRSEDVRRVLVVGAGTMGRQIAFQCAAHGFAVVVFDESAEALARAREQVMALARRLAGDPLFAGVDVVAATATIEFTTDVQEAAADIDLVSESVPEDPELKGRVFGLLDVLCPARTVFATNTSTLLPSTFADATGRPDRFAALHFHPPVWSSNLADVMPHPGTSPETTDLLYGFALRVGQVPVRLKRETPGYVFNAMFSALNGAALTLAANGIAEVADIDNAWTTVTKMQQGPFAMLDYVGLDTVWTITDHWARATGDAQSVRNAQFLKGYLDRGLAGVKTGQGFYDYRTKE